MPSSGRWSEDGTPPKLGFAIEQNVPEDVRSAYESLIDFTSRLRRR